MKNLNFIFIILFSVTTCFSQFNAYYPDGKKITFKYTTIRDILDTLHVQKYQSYNGKLGLVFFKKLSNKPVFIIFLDKNNSTQIRELIASYNYSKYIYSYKYYDDLKDMIRDSSLTKEYLKDVFNSPDLITKNEDSNECWIYKNYNLKVTFNKNIPQIADVINYKAITRNELAISSFKVKGGDYGMGFNISFSNFSKKVIKYVYITVTATNPVDDKIGTKTMKGVGPINSGELGYYEFSDVFISSTAEYLNIISIKILYMDGSVRIIPNSEVNKIKYLDWEAIGKD